VPGIVGPHMVLLRLVLLPSVEPRWVRQRQVPILTMAPLAAITLIPRATEAPRMIRPIRLSSNRAGNSANAQTLRSLLQENPALEKPTTPADC
jgi:hypothetical protein